MKVHGIRDSAERGGTMDSPAHLSTLLFIRTRVRTLVALGFSSCMRHVTNQLQ
jgi:hypothetical protein